MSDIYLYKRGQNQGPYPLDQIKTWLMSGQVQATAMGCFEGSADWSPLYCLPGIKDDPNFSPHVHTVTSGDREIEARIVQQTVDELDDLRERLDHTAVADQTPLQNQLNHKLTILWKQVFTFKAQFPDAVEAQRFEATLYTLQALARLGSVGFLRKASAKTNSLTWGLMTGLMANQQEKRNATEALGLLDKAISVFDNAISRLAKVSIYTALNQNEYALRELNYIVAHFQTDEWYITARRMKDEIEVSL